MPYKLKPLAAFVAGAFSVSSPFAHADDQTVLPAVNVSATANRPDTSRDYQPTVSTVGGKTEAAITDIPQTVTVVNKALMQAQGATSLADALRNAPGITIGGAEGGQIGNNINLRGFTARTDIYLDGFRDRGQYYRDVFDLEQVEVLQGPSSMLFGRGSTGGVINQVTKQAQLGHFTEISGTTGTDGRLRATLDTNSQLSDTAAMRINVFGQNLQTTRDTMENQDFGFAPTFRFGIGGRTELILSGLLQHNHDMPDYGVQSLNGHPITPSRDTFYGEDTDHTDQNIAMLNATIKHKFNDSMTLRNQTQFNRYTTDAVETAPRALGTLSGGTFTVLGPPAFGNFQPGELWVEMQSHDRNITDTSIDNQTDFISRFNTGFIRHELILGLEVGRDTYSNQTIGRLDPAIGYVNWVPFNNPDTGIPDSVTVSRGNLATSSANTLGVYANDTLSFGEQWKFITGIRHDNFRASINNTVNAPVGDTEQSSHFNSLREGLLYQPTSDQSYYVSYGTSFSPLLEQMTLTNGTQGLPPTETRSYEAGGKWMLMNDRLLLGAAAFDQRQKNVYTKDPDGNYLPVGNVLVKGYTLSAAGRLTDTVQISSGYMHLWPRVENPIDATDGSTPANTPEDTLTLWASWDVTHAWEIGGGAYYISKRYVADTATNVDQVSVSGYTRWDATVAYHKANYEIRLNVLNLTDKFYYDALIQSDGGRSVPGAGRTALLTASYRFR